LQTSQFRTIVNGKLTIHRADAAFFGEYQCFAENKNGKALTHKISINTASEF